MRRFSRSAAFIVGSCLFASAPADAFEVAGTTSFGVFQVGTTSRFAVAPGLAVRLGPGEGFNIVVQDSLVLFPGPGRFGFDNRTSVGLGWSWPTVDLTVGATLSQYWMPACGNTLCGQVMGLSPGAMAQVSYYPFEFAGMTATGIYGWYGGNSLVLPGGSAVTFTVGPVFRWKKK